MTASDKASNKTQDVKGNIKEGVGKATGNRDLEAKGKADQVKAALKDAAAHVKDAAGEVAEHVRDAADEVKGSITRR
ncbi:MAG TPA: CsbD family protein [Acidimicrobiales bacterium]|nr:CsbD family protein [Acidimicrobiales bacterium]